MPRIHGLDHRTIGIASRKDLRRWQPKDDIGQWEWSAPADDEENGTIEAPKAQNLVPSVPLSTTTEDATAEQSGPENNNKKTRKSTYRPRRRKKRGGKHACTANEDTFEEEKSSQSNQAGERVEKSEKNTKTTGDEIPKPSSRAAVCASVTPPQDRIEESNTKEATLERTNLRTETTVTVNTASSRDVDNGVTSKRRKLDDAYGGDDADWMNVVATTTAETNCSPDRTPVNAAPDQVLTRDAFLSTSPAPPIPVTDCASIPDEKKSGRGYLSSPEQGLEWWQIICPAMLNVFDLSFLLPTEVSNESVWYTNEGQQLLWEAHLLSWIHRDSPEAASRCFAQPLDLLVSEDSPCRLSLRLEVYGESADFLGSLEDVMRWNAESGALPESVIAWFILQILEAVHTLHHCNIAHNDLGLDSFLLVRMNNINDEGIEASWGLVCTGLGKKARKFCDEHTGESQKDGKWRFRHDLHSIANMANLLLSGGIPLETCATRDGVVNRHWDRIAFGNPCIGHGKTWKSFFHATLNPPTEMNGIHSLDAAILRGKPSPFSLWPELTDVARALLSLVGTIESPEESFLDDLLKRPRSERNLKLSEARFPVKLVEAPKFQFMSVANETPEEERYDILLREKIEEQYQALEREEGLKRELSAAADRFDEYHRQAEVEKRRLRTDWEAKLEAVCSEHKREIEFATAEAASSQMLNDSNDAETHRRELQELKEAHLNGIGQIDDNTENFPMESVEPERQIQELMQQLRQKNEELLSWQERDLNVKPAEKFLDKQASDFKGGPRKAEEALKQRERACREKEDRLRQMEEQMLQRTAELERQIAELDKEMNSGTPIKYEMTMRSPTAAVKRRASPRGSSRKSPSGVSGRRRTRSSPGGRSPRGSAPTCQLIDLTQHTSIDRQRSSPSPSGSSNKRTRPRKKTARRRLVIEDLSESDSD